MRFHRKPDPPPGPKLGDTRVQIRFALLPQLVDDKQVRKVWLERYVRMQVFEPVLKVWVTTSRKVYDPPKPVHYIYE